MRVFRSLLALLNKLPSCRVVSLHCVSQRKYVPSSEPQSCEDAEEAQPRLADTAAATNDDDGRVSESESESTTTLDRLKFNQKRKRKESKADSLSLSRSLCTTVCKLILRREEKLLSLLSFPKRRQSHQGSLSLSPLTHFQFSKLNPSARLIINMVVVAAGLVQCNLLDCEGNLKPSGESESEIGQTERKRCGSRTTKKVGKATAADLIRRLPRRTQSKKIATTLVSYSCGSIRRQYARVFNCILPPRKDENY